VTGVQTCALPISNKSSHHANCSVLIVRTTD